MERWIYKTGIEGSYELNVPEIAGREISGRIYRDGKEYRPSANNGTAPPDPARKEFRYNINLGKIYFAFQLGDGEPVDIPYYEIPYYEA